MAGTPGNEPERLREVLETALEKHNRAGAAEALKKLVAIEPTEVRWPHRLGEMLARLGHSKEAEEAYAKAAMMYADKGFLARAIAVAKLAVELNPARADLLAKLDPAPAQNLRRVSRPAITANFSPAPTLTVSMSAQPLVARTDAADDELSFDDAPVSCVIEVQEVDFDYGTLAGTGASSPDVAAGEATVAAERLARMSGATLFADVARDALADIAREAERLAFPDGAVVFVKGDRSDALLVLVEGRAVVSFEGRASIEVGEGDVLGETCILGDAVRTADVAASGELVALRVKKEALDRILTKHPAVGEVLFGLLARRLVADALERSPLFAPFDPATRAEIARSFEVRRAPPGTVLQEKGKKSDGLYVLLSGALDARDGEQTVRLPHATLLGHEMLVSRGPAPRTVTVATESVLLRLPAARFTAFVTEYPPALAHLAELAASA